MRVEDYFTAGQRKTHDAQGTYIYIERAPGWVQVETLPNGYVYDLPPRGQIILPDGEQFEKLNITNTSRDAGEIELSVGFGRYIPSNSGQVVTVDNVLGPIKISEQDVTPFRQYRQALRDIPQTYSNPEDVVWPQKPALPQSA